MANASAVALTTLCESSVPVVDLSPYFAGSAAGKAKVAAETAAACRSIGFLVISGHGVPQELIDRVDRTARAFFDLPSAEKQKARPDNPDIWRGYYGMETSTLSDTIGKVGDLPDLREYFTMNNPSVDRTDPYYQTEAAKIIFAPNIYPEIADFEAAWSEYYVAMETLAAALMRLFALGLGLDEHWFDDKIDRHMTNLTVSNYPEPKHAVSARQMRAGPHTDYGSLTILRAENKPGGLEVHTPQGTWERVPIVPGTLVVNLGDLMAQWTNDEWVSTLHRVVAPPIEQAEGSRRVSLTFFHQPNHDALIECIPTCRGKAARYAPITSGAHLESKRVAMQVVRTE
jgi:isopenicillin N synthase-like dioxygenase